MFKFVILPVVALLAVLFVKDIVLVDKAKAVHFTPTAHQHLMLTQLKDIDDHIKETRANSSNKSEFIFHAERRTLLLRDLENSGVCVSDKPYPCPTTGYKSSTDMKSLGG